MRRATTSTFLACAAALAVALAVCGPATASSGQLAVFQDDRQLLESGDATRQQTLAEVQALGVDVIKFSLQWWSVAPGTTQKPPGFDASDPAQYPAAGWARYAALVSEAQARGFRVMIAVTGEAPGWATARRGDRLGVDRPSGREYGRFLEAAGRRFPGVDLWALWNEPNHPRFLYPQSRRGVPYAPYLYRRLVTAGVAGLRRSGHGGNRILFGELLPIGKRHLGARSNLRPLLFLRDFFCVSRSWRSYRGLAARLRGCSRYRRVRGVNGFGYHPYTRPNGPRGREPSSDDATIRSIRRITRTLDRARSRRRIGGGRLSVWNTEFGYQSNPPDPFQTPIRRIPRFLNEAEWMSFRHRRVASYSQYTLRDLPLSGSGAARYSGWQGGLRFSSGQVKSDVYAAYRLPLFVRLLGPGAVEVWGAARPGGAGAQVQLQQRAGGAWQNLGGPVSITNPRGYFRRRYRIAKASSRSYRFVYVSGGATYTSRSAKAVVR